ncbi:MAG: hypothetical protein ACK56I_08195 [bacterium]
MNFFTAIDPGPARVRRALRCVLHAECSSCQVLRRDDLDARVPEGRQRAAQTVLQRAQRLGGSRYRKVDILVQHVVRDP